MSGELFVIWSLFLKKLPCFFVLTERLLVNRRKYARFIFKCVHTCTLRIAPRVRLESGRMHASFLLQTLDVSHVDETPDALWLSRRETDRITRFVEIATHAVDPAETERLIQRFGVGDALLSRRFLMKAN